ncbi:hypothetical protein EZS27_026423 [termite gut metagenome]|uniref:Uncharacterized protein n=1 Tax=termite gut metagenome TaxID=433724 RepID=A0A5J4QSD2_9ZZZZ
MDVRVEATTMMFCLMERKDLYKDRWMQTDKNLAIVVKNS